MSGVSYPENPWTRMIERAHSMNIETGGRAGITSAEPRPTAASAAVGHEVADVAPLTHEERQELDARARALGLLPPAEGEDGPYGSMEDALAAARGPEPEPAPEMDPVVEMAMRARNARGRRQIAEQLATELHGQREVQVIETPRLPDFTRVQGMDLQKGVCYLDSMEFPIPAEQLRKLRKFVVEIARLSFMERLNAATSLFETEATDGAGGEEVS